MKNRNKSIIMSLALVAVLFASIGTSSAAPKQVVGPVTQPTVTKLCKLSLNLNDEQQNAMQWISTPSPGANVAFMSDPYCCSKDSQERLDCLNEHGDMLYGYHTAIESTFGKLSELVTDKVGLNFTPDIPSTPNLCGTSSSIPQTVPEEIQNKVNELKCTITAAWKWNNAVDSSVNILNTCIKNSSGICTKSKSTDTAAPIPHEISSGH